MFFTYVRPFVCPIAGLYKSFQAIFMKPYMITDYCHGSFNLEVDPSKLAEWRPFWIFDA